MIAGEPIFPSTRHCRLARRVRSEPALIAVLETASAAMTLQRDAEMVRSYRHPEFSRQVIHYIVGGGAFAMRLHCPQRGIAKRDAGGWLAAARSTLGAGCGRSRSRRGRSASPPPLARYGLPAESSQYAFSYFQLTELVGELRSLGIKACKPLGNPLLFLPNFVCRSHLLSLLLVSQYLRAQYSVINRGSAHRKKDRKQEFLAVRPTSG